MRPLVQTIGSHDVVVGGRPVATTAALAMSDRYGRGPG